VIVGLGGGMCSTEGCPVSMRIRSN